MKKIKIFLCKLQTKFFFCLSVKFTCEFWNVYNSSYGYNQNLFLQYAKNSYEGLYYNKEMQLILNFLLDGKLEIFNSMI